MVEAQAGMCRLLVCASRCFIHSSSNSVEILYSLGDFGMRWSVVGTLSAASYAWCQPVLDKQSCIPLMPPHEFFQPTVFVNDISIALGCYHGYCLRSFLSPCRDHALTAFGAPHPKILTTRRRTSLCPYICLHPLPSS